jgi:hypothetical protein
MSVGKVVCRYMKNQKKETIAQECTQEEVKL